MAGEELKIVVFTSDASRQSQSWLGNPEATGLKAIQDTTTGKAGGVGCVAIDLPTKQLTRIPAPPSAGSLL